MASGRDGAPPVRPGWPWRRRRPAQAGPFPHPSLMLGGERSALPTLHSAGGRYGQWRPALILPETLEAGRRQREGRRSPWLEAVLHVWCGQGRRQPLSVPLRDLDSTGTWAAGEAKQSRAGLRGGAPRWMQTRRRQRRSGSLFDHRQSAAFTLHADTVKGKTERSAAHCENSTSSSTFGIWVARGSSMHWTTSAEPMSARVHLQYCSVHE